MSNQTTQSGGIGFFGILGIIFIVLKLIGQVDWSWYWTLSPFHLPISFGLVFLGLIALFNKETRLTGGFLIGVPVLVQGLLLAWLG